nr:unnamed protein product [Callosobruchus analis]
MILLRKQEKSFTKSLDVQDVLVSLTALM